MATSLQFIKQVNGTSVAEVKVTDCFTDQYDSYYITFSTSDDSVGTATDMRFLTTGETVDLTSDKDYARLLMTAHTSFSESNDTNQNFWRGMGEATEQGSGNGMYVFNPNSASYTFGLGQSAGITGTNMIGFKWIATAKNTTQYTGFLIKTADGTVLNNLDISVYGVKQ